MFEPDRRTALISAMAHYGLLPSDGRDPERDVLHKAKQQADGALVSAMKKALRAEQVPRLEGQDIRAVLLKPVSDHCNLRCSYCYEGLDDDRHEPGRMPEHMLRHIIAEACKQCRDDELQFLWHGGEPLLAGRALFEAGTSQQKASGRHGLRIRNAVQTNGILLDEDWISFLSEEGFAIGLSLDGPAQLHDAKRVDAAGRPTHGRVAEAIGRLRSRGVAFGVIAVIGPHHAGHARETIRHFHDLGVRNLDLHQDVGKSLEAPVLSPRAFADFMTEAFEEWLSIGDPGFRINIFDDFLRGWLGARPKTCYFNGSCGRIVAVEANGDVVPCTRPFDRRLNTFGSLKFQSFSEVADGPLLADFRERDARGIAKTRSCRWHRLCHGGCPQHRRSPAASQLGHEDVAGANPYCACASGEDGGYAALWSHVENRLYDLFLGSGDGASNRAGILQDTTLS